MDLDARQREYDNLRGRLEELRRTLMGRLGRMSVHLRSPKGDEALEFEEAAQEAENDEVLEQLDEQGRNELQRVELALQRMGTGNYGICVDCGEEIQLARLKAIPWATRCVDCARSHTE